MTDRWVVITQPRCKPCIEAKEMLRERGIEFTEFTTENNYVLSSFLKALLPRPTTPQVFINGSLIGGRDALRSYLVGYDLCHAHS